MPIECEFSETSFAFAYTREALDLWGPAGAVPSFPSTYAEGALGYDVQLTQTQPLRFYFAQFKLSEQIHGFNGKLRDDLGLPYFQFKLRKKPSMQHRLLVSLESLSPFNAVEYVAPRFTSGIELQRLAASKSVVAASIRVRPSEIAVHVPNAYDGATHYVGDNGKETWAASEPRRIETPNIGDLRFADGPASSPNREWADDVLGQLEGLLDEVDEQRAESARQRLRPPGGVSPFLEVASFCRAYLGGELIPITGYEPEQDA